MSSARIPSGWFPDPENAQRLRYWDGRAWTQHVHTPDPTAAVAVGRASNLFAASIVIAVVLWLPVGFICGIAGAIMSKRARMLAKVGDVATATSSLNRVRALLIGYVVVFVVFWTAFTVYFVAGGPS